MLPPSAGAAVTLLAMVTCAVVWSSGLVAVDAAPTFLPWGPGPFQEYMSVVRRMQEYRRDSGRYPHGCFTFHADIGGHQWGVIGPFDLTTDSNEDDVDVLDPGVPWNENLSPSSAVPVYRGSSVGAKAWYRGFAAPDKDLADDTPTRVSFSLLPDGQDHAEDVTDELAEDVANERSVDLVNKDVTKLSSKELAAVTKDTVDEFIRELPDDTATTATPVGAKDLAEIVQDLDESIEHQQLRIDANGDLIEDVADDNPTRLSFSLLPAEQDLAQDVANELAEDVTTEDLVLGVATDLAEGVTEGLADDAPLRLFPIDAPRVDAEDLDGVAKDLEKYLAERRILLEAASEELAQGVAKDPAADGVTEDLAEVFTEALMEGNGIEGWD